MTPRDYFTLGRSGLRISRLALGTMTFGPDPGWGTDEDSSRQMFNHYVDGGGNLLDTADVYTGGTSEEWTGKFIRERKLRNKVVITTKFSFNTDAENPNAGGNSRRNMLRSAEASLRRLGTDYIDLYLMHCWDLLTEVDEVMRGFDDLVRSGKVRYVGFSNVPGWYAGRAQALAECRGLEPIVALQMEYSLVERSIEHEFVPFAIRHGAGLMAWSPLASGLLTGKYRPSTTRQYGEGRLQNAQDMTNPAFAKLTPRNFAIAAELEIVAREAGHSMAQVALNWVANRPGVATVVLGATRMAQLEDNLGALEFTLVNEHVARLDAISAQPAPYPYHFFTGEIQGMISGEHRIGDKPPGYQPAQCARLPP